jgi:hypothetical protein
LDRNRTTPHIATKLLITALSNFPKEQSYDDCESFTQLYPLRAVPNRFGSSLVTHSHHVIASEADNTNLFSCVGWGASFLRTIRSNMFQAQQNPGRGVPLGANRLQNGKMGEDAP